MPPGAEIPSTKAVSSDSSDSDNRLRVSRRGKRSLDSLSSGPVASEGQRPPPDAVPVQPPPPPRP